MLAKSWQHRVFTRLVDGQLAGSPATSGGYSDFVFRAAARELFGREVTAGQLVYKSRRPQRPSDASIIVLQSGDIVDCNDVELQRQSLRRRMAKPSKTSDAIECSAKGQYTSDPST